MDENHDSKRTGSTRNTGEVSNLFESLKRKSVNEDEI